MTLKTQISYFDGLTSTPHKTVLVLDRAVMELKFTADGGSPMSKSVHDVEYEVFNDSIRVRFKNSEIHFVIEDKDFANELENLIHSKVKNSIPQRIINFKFRTHLLIALALIPVIVALYIFITPVIAKKSVYLIPVSFDVQLGNAFAGKFIKTENIDSAKTALLAEFAGNIQWDNKISLDFFVVNDIRKNALSLPNGNIILFSALLDQIYDYEALAALLAHEAAHVNNRHSIQALSKALIGYAMMSVLLADVSGLMTVLIENADMLNNLSFSRDAELEADNAAITTLDKNGINPNGKLKLMKILQRQVPGRLEVSLDDKDLEFLSTHPATEKRVENIEARIKSGEYAKKTYAENAELRRIFEEMAGK
jgi:Zn-dependent protease with chaperone function